MAILKNTVISGSLRATDTLAAQTAQFKILNAPTTSNGTTYGPGTNGQILKSNGTSVYWDNANNHTHNYAASSSAGGSATYAATTEDASSTLYPIGVKSGATTALKQDTSITMTGGTISANKYLATHIAGASNEFRVVYGSTIDMAFMVGTANENHGIYDYKVSKWVLSAGSSNTWSFDGTAAKATAANLTTTANAVAYYTNATGTFGTKASANGALYATATNGALSWGTLPVAQGGTGATSFTANSVIMSGNTTTAALTTKGITDNNEATAVSSSDTNLITARTLYYAGYVKSSGVTSVTPGNGLINGTSGTSQTAITGTGTISIKEGGVTNAMLAGSIANGKLTNSKITINNKVINLGDSVSLGDLGLSQALRFIGKASTTMSETTTTAPTITGITSYTPQIGDVVLDSSSDAEFVCVEINGTTYTWERLGRDSSWALDNAVIHNTLTSTKGDMIYASAANTPARLAIGSNGQFLMTNSSGIPAWSALPSASDSVAGITKVGASGGAAAYSHGNHVPTTQTADNAKFLRNDNTWQTVTPANIGAAASDHTHTTSLVSGGTATVTLSANTAYTLTAGGTSVIFKTPADSDTKNTAGSSDSNQKLFLIGATSQTTSSQTYSDSHVFETNGAFSAKTLGVNYDTDADKVTLQWNNTDSSLEFVFA